jgi:hypothetical protein
MEPGSRIEQRRCIRTIEGCQGPQSPRSKLGAAVARRDLKTLAWVGTMKDALLSADAASALAGSFAADSAATTERVERVSRRGRSSGSNCDNYTNRRTSA